MSRTEEIRWWGASVSPPVDYKGPILCRRDAPIKYGLLYQVPIYEDGKQVGTEWVLPHVCIEWAQLPSGDGGTEENG